MQYRRVGNSGLRISEITYGNWLTHGSKLEEGTTRACVMAALDEGITTFDTADVYADTRAEQALGQALHGIRRESVEICTKVFWPVGPGPNDRGLSRKHILASATASLRRLRVDYLDLYQAHRYDHQAPLEETLLAFDDLVRQGKVLYVGVSEWRAEQITAALEITEQLGLRRIVSNQAQYNLLWRVIETEVVPASQRAGVGQIAFSPLAQGALTGKYRPGAAPPAGSRATDQQGAGFIVNLLTEQILLKVEQLRPIAEQAGLTLAQLAVAWTLQNPAVAGAVVGASRPEQIRENAKAAGVRLDHCLLRRIDDILAEEIVTDPAYTPASSTHSTAAASKRLNRPPAGPHGGSRTRASG